ncbi:MAG: CDP-glycerol glycerophosphotransferase family protein [Treponema sp.]|nr:CDP-glycerol glycerophosphotransferase family protein [Treponema sp.]
MNSMNFIPLYIDPGTGSMLFSLFIGLAAAATFGVRALFLKLKFIFSGGKVEKNSQGNSIPFVIFSDHKRYWNVFKPICDEFERRGIDLTYYTASPDDPVLDAAYSHVHGEYLGEKNRPYAKLNFLQADVLLATTPNLDVYQWKRSKGVKCYVHIPHSVSDFAGYRMFALDHYDSVLASGENQHPSMVKLENLRPAIKRKEFTVVGSTYLDSMEKRLESAGRPETQERKMVLVAPTWGKSGILARFGEKFLDCLTRTEYEIVVRPHPQSKTAEKELLESLEKKYPDIKWNYDNDNFDILNRADIMITDFSGVIFDYSLVFDKPVIYADTSFDSGPYDADWLDEPMWEFRILSKIGIQLKEDDFGRIGEIIGDAISSENLKASRREVRDEAWQNRGNAAASVVDYLVGKQKELVG